jgi:hypothetical protein
MPFSPPLSPTKISKCWSFTQQYDLKIVHNKNISKIILFTLASKRAKYLGINLTKKAKHLCTKPQSSLIKEIRYQQKTFWIRRLNTVHVNTAQSSLWIQYNLFPKVQWCFYRKTHPKMQGTPNSQDSFIKEKWSWRTHLFWFQSLLQSYSNQKLWYWPGNG